MASKMGFVATAMVAAAAGACCGVVSVQASAHPSNSASTPTPSSFPLTDSINEMLSTASHVLARIPGSAIFLRYVRSSYQDDPIRSLLELFLLVFAIRTVLQSRTRGGSSGSNFVKLSEKVRMASLSFPLFLLPLLLHRSCDGADADVQEHRKLTTSSTSSTPTRCARPSRRRSRTTCSRSLPSLALPRLTLRSLCRH